MKKKKPATTALAARPTADPTIMADARIALGMFFTLTGTVLAAFGYSTRDRVDFYMRSGGIDANLWWGLALLAFGVVMLAFGRRGQMKLEKSGSKQ